LSKVFKMDISDLIEEIHEENIEILDRNFRYEKEMQQKDKQRKRNLQKKITHNFKNKHTNHIFKKK
jgi:hypothetical protein